ncbi:MAG: phospho-N-acetylmuramoyl-pentapeptide-transferase [Bacilli bacterium]|nr:phospho-N-acetylmuramoyl-pentapeptide-transferase [Bacilli bacterium]
MVTKIIFFGMFIALVLSSIIIPIIIPIMHRLKYGQAIRVEGPQSHYAKAGTPTMGGIVFSIVTFIVVCIFFLIFKETLVEFNLNNWILIFVPVFGYALIGFIDDYLIIVRKTNNGLSIKQKLILQILIAGIFFYIYSRLGYSTRIYLTGNFSFDLKWFYGILCFLILVGSTNAVNFTDGLDGLAGGVCSFAVATFTFIAYQNEQYDLVLFGSALLGVLLGFLIYNVHPAKIFMGDTGSLTLGACLSIMAILTKRELFLILVGGVFVIEALSVILQIIYFKRTNGKRLFKMAPLHHHLELLGYRESTIVLMFYLAGLFFSAISILIVLFA